MPSKSVRIHCSNFFSGKTLFAHSSFDYRLSRPKRHMPDCDNPENPKHEPKPDIADSSNVNERSCKSRKIEDRKRNPRSPVLERPSTVKSRADPIPEHRTR